MKAEIDVLICGFNEAPNIPRVLESLRAQTVGGDKFRVIYVDNASTDDTRRVVEENAYGLQLEYVYEGRQGKNWACNAGYERAQADYVAHLDADAQADSRWLENILRVIEEHRPDLFGGPLYPYYITAKPAWYLDRYNTDYRGDTAQYLPGHNLNGSNMIWRRSLVEQLGGFDTSVGLKGRGLIRGDETSLMVKAKRTVPDFAPFYDPSIIVSHLIRPEAMSLWYWTQRAFVQGRHDHKVWNMETAARSRLVWVAEFLRTAALVCAKGAKAFVRRDKSIYRYWKNYCYEALLPDVHKLGLVWELIDGRRLPNTQSSDADETKGAL